MSIAELDISNKHKCYLNEKELFILYYLLKNKHISTLWSHAFVPDNSKLIHIPTGIEDATKYIEEETAKIFDSLQRKTQSASTLSYLINLGRDLDKDGFSIYCNADYATIEGGFLNEYVGELMREYLKDTDSNRKKLDKYKKLNKEQKQILEDILQGKSHDSLKYSTLEHPVIEEYREAIINGKAEKDFIEVVNKLITDYDGGKWNTEDAEKFLEIWYRHNKEQFRKNAMSKKTFLYEDYQTKVARLIFEHIDIHLDIKSTKKLEQYLCGYIEKFKKDELNGSCGFGLTRTFFSSGMSVPLHTKLFGFRKQESILIQHIKDSYKKYQRTDLEIGSPYFEPEYTGNAKKGAAELRIAEENEGKELFLFVHTMIALEYDKIFEIEKFSYGTTGIFDMYDRGFLFHISLREDFFKTVGLDVPVGTNLSKEPKKALGETTPVGAFTLGEKERGYVKFGKKTKKILVGGVKTRKYRLLNCLLENIGTARTVDSMFDRIKRSKDDLDSTLKDEYTGTNRKREIIETTIKELQRIKLLRGKFIYKWTPDKRSLRIEVSQ